MDDQPKVVAITGASGYIGARLLRELQSRPYVGSLVAFDVNPLKSPQPPSTQEGQWEAPDAGPTSSSYSIVAYQQDLTRPITDALRRHGVTTLVHLAHIIKPGRDQHEIKAIRHTNLNALETVVESCAGAGVRHIIYLSSHTVYGARKENPIPLTEAMPPHPLPGFPYGYDKFLAEQVLQEFSERHPMIAVTILRTCVVLGPGANNYITRAFFRPLLLGIVGCDPPLQFLHEDDLARILTIIIQRVLPGVFNVAGGGVVHYRDAVKTARRNLVTLPASLAYPLVQLTWRLGIQRDGNAAGLNLIRYPIVMSTEKLKQSTGYQFQHTSLGALSAFANGSC